jgi:hypothetical protein
MKNARSTALNKTSTKQNQNKTKTKPKQNQNKTKTKPKKHFFYRQIDKYDCKNNIKPQVI